MKLSLLALCFITVIAVNGSDHESPGLQKVRKSYPFENLKETFYLEQDLETQSRKGPCRKLEGRCVRTRRDCPDGLPVVTKGRAYCSKKRKCCSPGDNFVGPFNNIWSDDECRYITRYDGQSLSDCKIRCSQSTDCTAINFAEDDCVLRACELPVPHPQWHLPPYQGYKIVKESTTTAPTARTTEDLITVNESESEDFALKHIESGLWVQVWKDEQEQGLILQETLTDMGKWKVEYSRGRNEMPVHVKHVVGGKYWHPHGGDEDPDDETIIVIFPSRPNYALFRFNQATNIIYHNMDKNIKPDPRDDGTPPGTTIRLYNDKSNAQFKAFSFSNTSKEIRIYGPAAVTSYWAKVFSLDSPAIVPMDFEQEVTLGYIKEESSSTSITFSWEITAKKQFEFAEMSTKFSTQVAVEKSSSETWSEMSKTTISITVGEGKTVAVWQRVFKASQMDHWSVQNSNEYAHTINSTIKPDDDEDSIKSFWI